VILCVDDEPTELAERQVLLSVAGYTVLTALRGGKALKLFRYNRVDVVIITGPLLDPNRANLVSEMKRLKPEVPIVLFNDITAPSSEPRQTDLQLTKGITPSDFLAELAKLLAGEGPVEPRKVDQG
jgi:DNA-binding response OmpR family regulator